MNLTNIADLCKELAAARSALQSLEADMRILDGVGSHQNLVTLSVNIGSAAKKKIDLVAIGGREVGWTSQQVRGAEMLMLGVKKWYSGEIDKAQGRVLQIEEKLRAEVGGAA